MFSLIYFFPEKQKSPIGLIPKQSSFRMEGLQGVDYSKLFETDKNFWLKETSEIRKYFADQVGADLPAEITKQLNALEERVKKM